MKFFSGRLGRGYILSHPSWGAWIEINTSAGSFLLLFVAPLMGCVD